MGKVKAVPQFSESISSFCRLMENAQRDYAWNYDEVNRMDIGIRLEIVTEMAYHVLHAFKPDWTEHNAD